MTHRFRPLQSALAMFLLLACRPLPSTSLSRAEPKVNTAPVVSKEEPKVDLSSLSLDALLARCDENEGAACRIAALRASEEAPLTPQTERRAFLLLSLGCQKLDAASCYDLAHNHMKDAADVAERLVDGPLELSCKLGHARA